MIGLALALALQVLPAPASVQWEEVNTDRAGRNAIDPDSISRTGDLARFRLRVIYADPATHLGVSISISEIVIDCQRRQFAIVAADGYGEDGQLIFSRAVEPSQVQYMPLAGIDRPEALRARVCGETVA